MSDVLKDFDLTKILLWVVPGAFIALFRSFFLRGTFPSFSKDDVAAFILGSVVYYFVVVLLATGLDVSTQTVKLVLAPWTWFFVLIVLPALVGAALGLVEAGDIVGRALRKFGIRIPSPDATAWETFFRELDAGAVLQVTLKDGTNVFGRWIGGKGGSASSNDAKTMDLFLGEIGEINDQGQYVAYQPQRGVYISSAEIRYFEVVARQWRRAEIGERDVHIQEGRRVP
jgi:hypothetical protein